MPTTHYICLVIIRIFLFLVLAQHSFCQKIDSTRALHIAIGSEVLIYGASMYALNDLWYKDYPKSDFHWINDNSNWLQMDKFGHATTAYTIGVLGKDILQWSGVPKQKALWYGGLYGSVYLTTIEVLDGFSEEWGASFGDLLANTAGTALFIGQELLFNEQKVQLKYSFAPTSYSNQRPDLLGHNLMQQALKDYNGQTYWLSIGIDNIVHTSLPKWLNVAFGYGANGMYNGTKNDLNRTREYYLSLDINLRKVETNSTFLNKALKVLGFIKIPMPALKFFDHTVTFYGFHYGQ